MIQEEGQTKYYISLQQATKFCNYSQEYLSLRARQGKLKSLKLGRNWVTTKEWLEEYLSSNGNGNAMAGFTKSHKFVCDFVNPTYLLFYRGKTSIFCPSFILTIAFLYPCLHPSILPSLLFFLGILIILTATTSMP